MWSKTPDEQDDFRSSDEDDSPQPTLTSSDVRMMIQSRSHKPQLHSKHCHLAYPETKTTDLRHAPPPTFDAARPGHTCYSQSSGSRAIRCHLSSAVIANVRRHFRRHHLSFSRARFEYHHDSRSVDPITYVILCRACLRILPSSLYRKGLHAALLQSLIPSLG